MTSRGSNGGAPPPVNDSIDELLEGMPAEPILPKKRAKLIDRNAPPPSKRRVDDNVVVSEGTDPRERARREQEVSRRGSSTFGTGFLQANATRQRLVVAALMMIGVLGIYAFVRHRRSEALATSPTIASNPSSAIPTTSSPSIGIASDALPPVLALPVASAVATTTAVNATKAAAGGSTHKSTREHVESHVPPTAPTTPPSASANSRTDVARSL